jgi:hypothetical protein
LKRHYALAAVVSLALAAMPAQAHFTVDTGNPGNQGTDNVLFNEPGLISSGTTVQGITNTNPGQIVDFTGDVALLTNGGQAKITALNGGTFDRVEINMNDPLVFFTKIIFNVDSSIPNNPGAALKITAYHPDGTVDSAITCAGGGSEVVDGTCQYTSGGNQNFFNIVASGGQLVDRVIISGEMSSISFDELQQVRLGGVTVVPEPGFYGLLALGVSGLFVVRRRKATAVPAD